MPRHIESRLQTSCVRWFRLAHREFAVLLNSVPNGLLTSATQARIAVAEGLTKGVADLELNIARGPWHGLKIEMKEEHLAVNADGRLERKRGYQSPDQRAWQAAVEAQGYRYAVCRSLDEFRALIEDYLAADVISDK